MAHIDNTNRTYLRIKQSLERWFWNLQSYLSHINKVTFDWDDFEIMSRSPFVTLLVCPMCLISELKITILQNKKNEIC